MYTGPGNLSSTALIEQLIFMANESSSLISELYKILSRSEGLPRPEVIDKYLRQDVAMSKDRVDATVEKMLYYIASSRIDLIDHKEFFINIALRYRTIMSLIEDAAYRLLLLARKAPQASDSEIMGNITKLVKLGEETLYMLASELRGLIGTSSITSEQTVKTILKNIENISDKIKLNEKLADEIYRELDEKIIDKYADNSIAIILLRELLATIENIIDTSVEQTTDVLILARSFA